jgi:hypothetical protein
MPKATAVWLIENTGLSFEQISAFCELHTLEVQAIADEEVAVGIVGIDPITNGQLTREEIERCEQDPDGRLEIAETTMPRPTPKTKGPRYTPVAMRQERPDVIAWLLRHYPELSDAQISRLVGTTKSTINAVRDRTHWKGANIKPVDPVDIGICSYEELLAAVQIARKRKARAEERAAKEAAKREREAAKAAATAAEESPAPVEATAPASPFEAAIPSAQPGPAFPAAPQAQTSEDVADRTVVAGDGDGEKAESISEGASEAVADEGEDDSSSPDRTP